jgi:hypothetical protein
VPPPPTTESGQGGPGSPSLVPGGQNGPPRGEPVTPTAAVPTGEPSPIATATATSTSPSATASATPSSLGGLPATDCEGIG